MDVVAVKEGTRYEVLSGVVMRGECVGYRFECKHGIRLGGEIWRGEGGDWGRWGPGWCL